MFYNLWWVAGHINFWLANKEECQLKIRRMTLLTVDLQLFKSQSVLEANKFWATPSPAPLSLPLPHPHQYSQCFDYLLLPVDYKSEI